MFACCHPALDLDTQTGLTLRYVAGLSTAQIAQAFLVPSATMAQRLTRGKRKIQQSRIPFRVPGPDELEGRLGLVLHVVYLIFTEGYAATGHHDLVRCDLVDEAIRLARILHRLMPGEPRSLACSHSCCSPTPGVRPGSTSMASPSRWKTRTAACGIP
jgi:RNA polymerase sigma-70 factor (ECF subfamily)